MCGISQGMHESFVEVRSGETAEGDRARAQVWVSPVRPRVIEALLSFTRLEAVRLEAYSSLETACCFSALKHLPVLTHLDLRLSGSHYALADNVDALHSLAKCPRLVRLAQPPDAHPLYVSGLLRRVEIFLVGYLHVQSSGTWLTSRRG